MASEAKLKQAMVFIQDNLGRLDLSAALVARCVAVSRSVLYRLFEAQGGVACVIKRQRLLTLREVLSSAGETERISVLTRRCGFISASHASRNFSEVYGITPKEYQAWCRAGRQHPLFGMPHPEADGPPPTHVEG